MNNVKNNASILAIMGKTGSGKSAWLKQQLKKWNPKRMMIWDPMKEYDGYGIVTDKPTEFVHIAATAGNKKPFVVTFRPSADPDIRSKQFDIFCKLAVKVGNLLMLVEELKFVTKPSYAPLPWAQCNLQGRHCGLKIIGTSQRPASIDKDFLYSATVIHTGRLLAKDLKVVAEAMEVSPILMRGMKPLEFVERNMQTGELVKGKVTF